MIYPSIDKLLNIIDSKYVLVHIAAKRSRQIKNEQYLQMPRKKYKSSKNIGKALEEVAEEFITIKNNWQRSIFFIHLCCRGDMMNNKGQALVEYVLIIALVSVVIIGLVNVFGGYLKDAMTKTNCSLVGKEYVEGEKSGEGYCK